MKNPAMSRAFHSTFHLLQSSLLSGGSPVRKRRGKLVRHRIFGRKQKIPTISGEDSKKTALRKVPPLHSSPAIATHFCRGSYPQLPVDVVQFVGIGLSFDRLRIHPKVDEYPCSLLPRWSNIFAETQSSLGSAGRRIVTVWTSFGGNRAGHLGEENVLRPPGPSRKPLLRPTQLPTSDHAQKYTLIHSSTLSCICFPPYSVVVPPARIVGQTMNSTFITGL